MKMASDAMNVDELHWLLGILQHVDVGLVVLDRGYEVRLWNGFMENHSGLSAASAIGSNLFTLMPDLPQQWLQRKVESVFTLDASTFSTWQQLPYLFKFPSYRPITGRSEQMYQNITVFPLLSPRNEVEHVCLMVYDATETAMDELELQDANAELARLGRTDGLTGLLNRRAWDEELVSEYKRTQRSGMPCSLVMFDIDHFKRINDEYGHQAGDEAIRAVARMALNSKRELDIAGRYGGEEFGVILVDTDAQGAMVFAERLRHAVMNNVVAYGDQAIRYTISLGVATLQKGQAYTQWIEEADQALYASKHGGRNRATLAEPGETL